MLFQAYVMQTYELLTLLLIFLEQAFISYFFCLFAYTAWPKFFWWYLLRLILIHFLFIIKRYIYLLIIISCVKMYSNIKIIIQMSLQNQLINSPLICFIKNHLKYFVNHFSNLSQSTQMDQGMLLVNSHHVELKKTYQKILYLYPALNDTFVFLGVLGLRQDCVTHVDKNGKVLFQHVFSIPMDSFGMMDQKQCIMLQTRSKWYLGSQTKEQYLPGITILDLVTHQFRRTPHMFRLEQTDRSQIVCFSQSKLLCIQQQGQFNDNHLQLSYYSYPLSPNDKPFRIYNSKDDQWTYEHLIRQGNNHSMMIWFKARMDKDWIIKTYDLRDDQKGAYSIYNIKQQVGLPYNIKSVHVALNNIWESTKNCFMMICISDKPDTAKNQDLNVVQNIYILDTKSKIVRQARFGFGELHPLQIDHRSLGQTCMIRTFDFLQGKPVTTPIYYINNQTQQIVAQQRWQCGHLHKQQPTGVDSGLLITNQYENADCTWFRCSSKKVMKVKEITMHFMLSIYQGWDDDLLQDVVEIVS